MEDFYSHIGRDDKFVHRSFAEERSRKEVFRSLLNYVSVHERQKPVGKRESVIVVMGGEHSSSPRGARFRNDLQDEGFSGPVNICKRFVEKKDFRLDFSLKARLDDASNQLKAKVAAMLFEESKP